jgi:sec-independent protein translocase protein TatA
MEIFGIGLPELLLIAVVALIVMGPDRLPEAARSIGRAVYDFRKAIEPARTAWNDVQREITTGLDIQGQLQGRSTAVASTGSATAAASATQPTGNPWKVHPLAEGLSDEERQRFFETGEIPVWKRQELEDLEKASRNGHGKELPALDYPMPHAEMAYQPAPPFAQLEDLDYPEPGNVIKEEETEA